MPIYPHTEFDPIPEWVEHDPGEVITHAIKIKRDTYILHFEKQDGTCFLASQWFDRQEETVKWMHSNHMPTEMQDMLNILLDLCNRLIHGDEHA